MYMPPSTPRAIGGVLDDTLRLYRSSFAAWIAPSLILAVIRFAIGLYLNSKMNLIVAGGAQSSTAIWASWVSTMQGPGVWEGYLVLMFLDVWLYTALIANIFAVASGRLAKPFDGFGIGIRLLPAALLGSLLFGMAMIGGMILLIIPGLYVIGRMIYWTVALVDERAGATSAIGTSWRLVHGHWWRATTILGVLFIIMMAVGFLVAIIAGITVAVARPDLATIQLLTQAISGILNVFFIALVPAALVATYQDLKLRAGGGDLAARISNVPTT
jgi:hypothetical protein